MQRRNCNKAYCMIDKNRRCAGSGAPAVFQKSVAVPVVEHFAEIAVSEGFAVDEEVADAAVAPHDLVAVVDGSAVDLEEQRVEAIGIFLQIGSSISHILISRSYGSSMGSSGESWLNFSANFLSKR